MNIIMLIGLPGSGKTTKRKEYVERGYSYISSDEIRKIVLGDESDQTQNKRVFDIFYKHLKMNCDHSLNTVLDATNLTVKDRAKAIEMARSYDHAYIAGVVMNTSVEECIERDAKRERSVGPDVILRLSKRFQPPTLDEGFDIIFS